MEEGRKNRPNTIHLHTNFSARLHQKKTWNQDWFFWIDHQIQFSFFTNSYGVGVIENLCMFISRREIKNSTLSKYMCSPSLMCQ